MRALAALAILAAAGCTPMQWVRPATEPAQAQLDLQSCQQAAWREAQLQSFWYYSRAQPYVIAPGHVVFPPGPFVDPFAGQMLAESRLAQFCMEAKGYQLAPAPKP